MRFLLAALLCFSAAAHAAPPRTLTVIATTDFHGALEAETVRLSGDRSISIGGPAVMSAYLNILKQNAPGPVLYLDAGDLFQGTMASNLFEGAPVTRLYNYLNPAASALGNHEFDYGPVGPHAVPRDPGEDPQGALKARIKDSKFPILGINVRDQSGKIPSWLKGSLVKEIDSVRVGIIGAADEGTPGSTNRLNLVGLKFLDPVEPIRAEAERLRKEEGVSAVVVTIHVGAGCDDNDLGRQDDLSSCKINDIFGIVKRLPEGLVDVVVAGHTHRGVAKRVGRTAIMQAYSSGKYVAWASVPLNDASKSPAVEGLAPVCTQVVSTRKGKTCDPYLAKDSTAPIEEATFLGEKIVPDANVEPLIRPELAKVETIKEKSLGVEATEDLTRNYSEESALGDLLADAAKDMIPGLDLGMTNGGGIRANFNRGPITYGDVFNVYPFDNQLAVMTLSGDTLVKMAALGVDGGRGIFLWSSNLQLETDGCKIRSATINGEVVSPVKLYKVGTSDFLAGGGSGISKLKIPSDQINIYWDPEYILRDLTAKVLTKWNKPLRARDFYDPSHPRLVRHGACGSSGSGE